MYQLKYDILSHINLRKENVFNRWKENVISSSDQYIKDSIETHGRQLFDIILHAFSLTDNELENYIHTHALDVASRKLKDHSNIGMFVYNVNIAKNELYHELSHYPASREQIVPYVTQFSYIIDQFLYQAVTHYTNLKDQLIEEKNQYIRSSHEDRLSLLGQMSSSFVHEFRNPLTAVHGFVQLLRSENPELPYLDIIAGELDQLKFRITQFLMLSKKEMSEQEASLFTLNELLEQVSSFIYPRLLEVNVELQRELENDLHVKGFIEEFRQVIINIIFNAIEVMASQDSGSLIKIKGYREGDSTILSISNTGPKIPDYLINTIFEPFVTAKKSGTGIGLFVSKEIIEKHQGELLCESDESWTTFTIILPKAEKKEPEEI